MVMTLGWWLPPGRSPATHTLARNFVTIWPEIVLYFLTEVAGSTILCCWESSSPPNTWTLLSRLLLVGLLMQSQWFCFWKRIHQLISQTCAFWSKSSWTTSGYWCKPYVSLFSCSERLGSTISVDWGIVLCLLLWTKVKRKKESLADREHNITLFHKHHWTLAKVLFVHFAQCYKKSIQNLVENLQFKGLWQPILVLFNKSIL